MKIQLINIVLCVVLLTMAMNHLSKASDSEVLVGVIEVIIALAVIISSIYTITKNHY
jgi:hypothetical protein